MTSVKRLSSSRFDFYDKRLNGRLAEILKELRRSMPLLRKWKSDNPKQASIYIEGLLDFREGRLEPLFREVLS